MAFIVWQVTQHEHVPQPRTQPPLTKIAPSHAALLATILVNAFDIALAVLDVALLVTVFDIK